MEATDCLKSSFCPYSDFHKQDSQGANSTFPNASGHPSSPGMAGHPCSQGQAWAFSL